MATRTTRRGAVAEPTPLAGHRFRVAIGSGRAAVELGFVRVEFPPLRAARGEPNPADGPPLLVLRRGFDGRMALADWWQQQRAAAARTKPREVLVDLLAADGAGVALRWRFAGCRPVALEHSALDAMRPAVLLESLSLTFEDVELSAPRG